MRKTILHIITSLADGGAEAVLFRFCNEDRAEKHIIISLMDESKYGSLLREQGFEVYALNLSPNRISILGIYKLYNIIKAKKPDVVQTWMYHADLMGGIVSRVAGINNVIWGVHNTILVRGESKFSTILIAKLNALLSGIVPRKIIYCAQKSRDVQEAIGYNKRKGKVVSNGYKINDFTPNKSYETSIRKSLNLSEDTFIIGHVGRFDPLKDHKNLIEAIANLPKKKVKFKVVLIGSNLDQNNSTLTGWIEKHQLNEFFYLQGPRNDIPVVMNGFDLFLLSSFAEAFPNVLNEAMACGTPCVSTDVGDASLIVGDTGWIVPPKDPKSMANSIMQAIDEKHTNTESWHARKVACRNRIVDNYSIDKMISSYKNVWFE